LEAVFGVRHVVMDSYIDTMHNCDNEAFVPRLS
jgi:hypothetical protein